MEKKIIEDAIIRIDRTLEVFSIEKWKALWFFLLVPFFLTTTIIITWVKYIWYDSYSRLEWIGTSLLLWFIITLWWSFYLFEQKIKTYLDELRYYIIGFFYEFNKTDDIDLILTKTEYIKNNLSRLITIYRGVRLLYNQRTIENYEEMLGCIIKIFIDVSINIKGDLSENIYSIQESLISAKSDVAKNITGTPDLMKVSELQQARLDSQIQEFEKLQKILVKV
jgi:hypothetical protein